MTDRYEFIHSYVIPVPVFILLYVQALFIINFFRFPYEQGNEVKTNSMKQKRRNNYVLYIKWRTEADYDESKSLYQVW